MKRSDIKRFIRESRGFVTNMDGDELFSSVSEMIQGGQRATLEVDCPKRSGYVIACDALEDLSPYGYGSSDFGFEGFFEDELGNDVFLVFSVDEVVPGSFEMHRDDTDAADYEVDTFIDEESDPASVTRDFMMKKFV